MLRVNCSTVAASTETSAWAARAARCAASVSPAQPASPMSAIDSSALTSSVYVKWTAQGQERLSLGLHRECPAAVARKNLVTPQWLRAGNGATPDSAADDCKCALGKSMCLGANGHLCVQTKIAWTARGCDTGSPSLGSNEEGRDGV